jgi:hypothetical protein
MNKPYKNISDTNTAFGNLFGSSVTGTTVTNYEKLYNQAKNLYDELDELRDDGFALLIKDPQDKDGRKEMVDAIADLLVFLYGLPHFLNVNYVEAKANQHIVEFLSEIPTPELYTTVYDDIKNLIDAVIESIQEKATANEMMEEIISLDTYLMSLAAFYKIDVTKLVQKVTDSNMSKLCENDADTAATLKFYRDKGVDVYSKDSPLIQSNGKPFQVVYSSSEQTVGGKVYRAHKFLKCVNWFEPDLYDI